MLGWDALNMDIMDSFIIQVGILSSPAEVLWYHMVPFYNEWMSHDPTHENLKSCLSEAFMPYTVKGKPLKKVSLSLTSRDICRGHCDILVVLSQYMDSVFYLSFTGLIDGK